MPSWMKRLAQHYDQIRKRYPEDELLILFDIDGTILDMRCMVHHVLKAFDEAHDTDFFKSLVVDDISVHENQVDHLLEGMNLPRAQRERVHRWYVERRWSSEAILKSHHAFRGVMEVIRWFQLQPRTSVGLNTGRPSAIREDTLRSLNELGTEYRVTFSNDLLFMNPGEWEENVGNAKVRGVRHFQESGYRVVAMIDNEPANLTAVADADTTGDILLLHADTIFESKRSALPSGTAGGTDYRISQVISRKALREMMMAEAAPKRVQFVWHGLNDEDNIRQFLASDIHWAEFDVRRAPDGTLIVRHDSLEKTPLMENEEFMLIDDVLTWLEKFDKCVKFDLKESGDVLDRIIEIIRARHYPAERLWMNGAFEVLGETGFRRLASELPGAIIQGPIDFLAPLIVTLPDQGKNVLDVVYGWGINRFSVNWDLPNLTNLLDHMDCWDYEVNLYNVPDLHSFLQAVLLQPRSITSDFNFPKWHYYGRGSGQDAHKFEYQLRTPDG